jgi:hypothetical protein
MNNINILCLYLGLLACICIYVTGSVSVFYDFQVHFAFAVSIFIPASIHIILYKILLIMMESKLMIITPKRQLILMNISFHITVTLNILVIIIDFIIYYTCYSKICRSYVGIIHFIIIIIIIIILLLLYH